MIQMLPESELNSVIMDKWFYFLRACVAFLTCEMGQWLKLQALLLDFTLQSISCSPFYSLSFPVA